MRASRIKTFTLAGIAVVGLVVAPAATASASLERLAGVASSAASASPLTVGPAALPAGPVINLTTGPVTGTGGEDSAYVGLDTKRFVVSTSKTASTDVMCTYYYFFGSEDEHVFTADEWSSGSVVLPIPSGTVDLAFLGTSYSVWCRSDDGAIDAQWSLRTVVSTGATSFLYEGGNPSELVERYFDRFDYDHPVAVHPRDVVRVTGVAGTWPTAAGAIARVKNLTLSTFSSRREAVLSIDTFSISSDGSVLTMTLPVDLSSVANNPPYDGAPAIDTMIVNLYSDYGPTAGGQVHTVWSTAVVISTDVKSAVSVALSSPFTLSWLPVAATARVTVPGGATPTGTVTFLVDGAKVGSVKLTATSRGVARLTLPSLPRGAHPVKVTYSGTAGVKGSVSPVAVLGVFL